MNHKFKILGVALLSSLLLVTFAACGKEKGDDMQTDEVRIEMNEEMIELGVGETHRLTVSVSPSDAMDKEIVWSSSDESIAEVDDGTVTAKAAGEATITASTNGKEATCRVTVSEKDEQTPDGGEDDRNEDDEQEPEGGQEEERSVSSKR